MERIDCWYKLRFGGFKKWREEGSSGSLFDAVKSIPTTKVMFIPPYKKSKKS